MTIWSQLGFSGNPYDSHPLKANEEGRSLLVGRDQESRELISQLENTTLHPTLEGSNGVGKTSLVLVSTYVAMEKRRAGSTAQTLVPIDDVLQIHSDADRIHRESLFAVAQALLKHKQYLEDCGHAVANLAALQSWLNSPVTVAGGGGAQILGIGANIDVTRSTNEGEGFLSSGLESLIRAALLETFPTEEDGSLVGIIDNVELLNRSNEAKRVLEAMRDKTLSLPRVRWVLCGALGIIRSSVTSPRLDGRVAPPIEIAPVAPSTIEELIEERLNYFSSGDTSRAPVSPASFRHLYSVCNANLRDALKYAQAFSVWLDVQDALGDPSQFPALMESWLAEEAEKITNSISVQPRAWALFDALADGGGSCAPSDNATFGFNTPQQMRTNFVALERASLIRAEIDEDDLRRRTVNVTDKGWVVRYARRGFTVV